MGMVAAIAAVASAGVGLASSIQQSNAIKAQGQYQSNQLEFNSKVANLQAEDAINRGNKDAAATKQKTKQIIGSQRAALAAQGIEVNADTALQIQEDTAGLGAEDIATIKNNAWLEAWGYRVQATDYSGQAQMNTLASKFNANQTLLTGGLNAARDVSSGLTAYKQYGKTPAKT